jgi:hypothetical protein
MSTKTIRHIVSLALATIFAIGVMIADKYWPGIAIVVIVGILAMDKMERPE